MSELPSSWIDVAIGEIAEVIGGGTPKTNDAGNFTAPGEGIAWLTPADLSGYKTKEIPYGARDLTKQGYQSCSAKLMPKGSLLFSSRAPIGYVAVAANEIATNQGFKSFVFPEGIDPSYAFFYLKSIRELADSLGTGTTFKELSGANAKALPFRLAPSGEQTRIAAKLDELLAQVDTLKSRIESIPALLKRFRQSVLAAAVSGRLTEEWRDNDEYINTHTELQIPNSWKWLSVGHLTEVKGGKRLPKGEELTPDNTGHPYIRAGQLKDGTVSTEGQLFVPSHVHPKISRYIVNSGDVYITIVGACIGDAGVIPHRCDGFNLTENAAKICNFKTSLNSDYLATWLRSQYLQELIRHEIKSGAQGKLALKRIKELPVPYPPLEEQTEIVRRVEQLFAFADQLEARVKAAQTRIDRLTQSILAKAFRGELVPQDPNDEPASALLERIKAQRAAVPKAKRGRRAATLG